MGCLWLRMHLEWAVPGSISSWRCCWTRGLCQAQGLWPAFRRIMARMTVKQHPPMRWQALLEWSHPSLIYQVYRACLHGIMQEVMQLWPRCKADYQPAPRVGLPGKWHRARKLVP